MSCDSRVDFPNRPRPRAKNNPCFHKYTSSFNVRPWSRNLIQTCNAEDFPRVRYRPFLSPWISTSKSFPQLKLSTTDNLLPSSKTSHSKHPSITLMNVDWWSVADGHREGRILNAHAARLVISFTNDNTNDMKNDSNVDQKQRDEMHSRPRPFFRKHTPTWQKRVQQRRWRRQQQQN
jgi:hypothetical protein